VLHVRSTNPADPFDRHFPLPASGWSYVGQSGSDSGYRYRDRSKGADIRSVNVKSGKPWKISGRGAELGPHLGADPDPVDVVLILGNARYCMAFGGTTTFDFGKRFKGVDAPAPASCP